MDHSCHKLLAGSVFPADEYPGVRWRCHFDIPSELLGPSGISINGFSLQRLGAEISVFFFKTSEIQGIIDGQNNLIDGKRLFNQVKSTQFGGLNRGLDVSVTGNDDHLRMGVVFFDLLERFNPIQSGHPNIQ